MITNPYKILGVPDGASEAECAAAYKKLAKKYHPDLNPNDESAAKKMAEINAAFDQIKSGNVNSQNQYGYTANRYRNSSNTSNPNYFISVSQFIRSGQYAQALNLLNQIEDRNAQWYYLSALANMGIGNKNVALNHIQQACAMEPNNFTYSAAYSSIRRDMNPNEESNPFENYGGFNGFGGFGGFNNSNNTEYKTYTYGSKGSNKGCLYSILKFVFIIVIIRLVITLILSFFNAGSNRFNRYRYANSSESSSYSQHFNDERQNDFNENFGYANNSNTKNY